MSALLFYLNWKNHNPLRELVTGERCEIACFAEFEPYISTQSEVENWLITSNFDYSLGTFGRKNDAIVIGSPSSDRITHSLAKSISFEFNQNDMLWRIILNDTRFCLESVVNTFGNPDLVDVGEAGLIRIGYPKLGLLFTLKTKENHVTNMFITSPEWVHYFGSLGQPSTGDHLQKLIVQQPCQN